MSGCQSIGALLDGYHDGELGSIERWRVERHLAGCAACRAELDSLAQLGGLVRIAVGRAPEADVWDSIAQHLPSRRPDRARRAPARPRWVPALSVGSLAAACMAAFLVTTSDSSHLASISGPSGVVRSIYANERQVMVIAPDRGTDPTIIWLMDELGEQSPEVSQSVGI